MPVLEASDGSGCYRSHRGPGAPDRMRVGVISEIGAGRFFERLRDEGHFVQDGPPFAFENAAGGRSTPGNRGQGGQSLGPARGRQAHQERGRIHRGLGVDLAPLEAQVLPQPVARESPRFGDARVFGQVGQAFVTGRVGGRSAADHEGRVDARRLGRTDDQAQVVRQRARGEHREVDHRPEEAHALVSPSRRSRTRGRASISPEKRSSATGIESRSRMQASKTRSRSAGGASSTEST